MKILILTPKPPFPARDGSSLATAQVIEGLAAKGHQVTVFFLNTSKHASSPRELPEKEGISFFSAFCNTTVKPGPALTSLMAGQQPYTVSRFITAETEKKLRDILRGNSFDIIQIETLMMTPYLDVIRESSDARIIFRPHNTEYLIWSHLAENEKNFLKKGYFNMLARQIREYERTVSRQFRYILPISDSDAEIFRTWNPEARMMTLPYGIDVKAGPQRTDRRPPAVLFLGALDWRPNLQGLEWFLKNIWPSLAQDIPSVRLFIAGRNPGSRIQETIRSYSPGGKITFLGEVDDPEDLYSKGSVFIVPLFAGSGIRIKILEAMAHGLAVISTHTGAAGLPVRDKEDILLADTPEDFRRSIEKLMQDEDFYTRITENALHLLQEKFDQESLPDDLEKFYLKA